MSRRRRQHSGMWHAIDRGAKQLDIYHDDADRRAQLTIIADEADFYRVRLHCYSLMDNHVHMIPDADETRLGRFMGVMKSRLSRLLNRKYGSKGTGYESPYKAFPLYSPWIILRTAAYIHLNPFAAGMVDAAVTYPWSSFQDYLGKPGQILKVDPTPILRLLHPDIPTARQMFVELTRDLTVLPHESKDPAWKVQGMQFRWLLEKAISILPLDSKAKTVAICWAHRVGVPPRVIARELQVTTVQVQNALRQREAILSKYPSP